MVEQPINEDLPRISRRVDNYIKYRPHYPAAILEILIKECDLESQHTIADVGSDTGILAKLFMKNGNPVFGVEPDPDMRAGAENYLQGFPKFRSVEGTAESTTLPDHGLDFVTAGQAFHWFDLEQTRKEFSRILVLQGWVVIVWNIQRTNGTLFLVALQEFWETNHFWKHASRHASQQEERAQAYRRNIELARQELLESFFRNGHFTEAWFENPMICGFQHLKGRVLSGGPALELDDPNFGKMLEALEEIFHAYQENGTVTIEHDTGVIYGQLPPE